MTSFKPNLTSDLMIRGVSDFLQREESIKKIIEVGCGEGYITRELLVRGHLDSVSHIFCSDIQESAIEIASTKRNALETQVRQRDQIWDYQVGNLLGCWTPAEVSSCDLIINDVSAVADTVSDIFGYFDTSVCGAGPLGLDNLEEFFKQLSKTNFAGSIVLPFLSLSNWRGFVELVTDFGWERELLVKQKWPLDTTAVQKHNDSLKALVADEIISVQMLGGFMVAETSVYKLRKVHINE